MEPKRPLFPIYDMLEHWAAFAQGTPEVKPQHHSLYLALVTMVKQRKGLNRFNLPFTDGMQASGIGSRNTYTNTLRELQAWGFVTYTPGANGLKAPIVAVHFCASAEHLLSIYRASADTSAEHIIKEVNRLKVEGDEKSVVIESLEKKVLHLQAQLAAQPSARPVLAPNPGRDAAIASTDPADEQHWSEGPLTKPLAFKAICERMGYPEVDFEYYRRAALVAAEDDNISRTIKQWNSWVRKFLENQKRSGPLLVPTPGGGSLPSRPTPKNELPQPRQEKPGQIIYIDGVPGDQNMDRMKAASYLNHFPTAVVVSLAYPQNPYQNKP